MSDSVTTEVYLDFNDTLARKLYEDGTLMGCKDAAEKLVADAERRFKSKTLRTGTGVMEGGFFDFKSKFEDGGWVGGVFDKPGEWTESVGGRAHFFEYGRSRPGFGKGHGGPQPVWLRKLWGQPPRPFIRPAKNKIRRELGGIFSKELYQVARKMNRSSSVNSMVMSAVNRIK